MPRILVADDEDFIALLLSELLEEMEYEVETVRNGRDALVVLAGDPPDLVIADIMMPHASGIEVLAAMRKQAETRDTPVILMSAASEPRVRDEHTTFIAKPFNVQLVLDTVAKFIGSRGPRKQPA